MNKSFLVAAAVIGSYGFSAGQKITYKPFHLQHPGPATQAVHGAVEPVKPEQITALSFLPEDFLPAPSPSGVLEWLDVDADGDMDYLLIDGSIKLFENSSGSFVEVAGAGLGMTATAHYVTDVNRDNRIDVMFIENRLIKVAYNNGDKTFTVSDTGIELEWDGAPPLYCYDVDGDTDLDIVTRPTSSFYAFIPSTRFGTTESISYPSEFTFMSFENLDNTLVLDFFLVYTDNAGYSVYSTSMTSGLVYDMTGLASTFNPAQLEVRWSDVDLDGDLDLFARTTAGWRFFMNNYSRNGTVQLSYSASFPNSVSGYAAIGDLNSDGKPDFVVTNSATNKIDVWRNQSSFENPLFVLDHSIPVTSFSRLYILDMDGAAGADIVSHQKIYKNTLTYGQLSPPPSTPTGLSCLYVGDRVYLGWNQTAPGHQYRYEVFKDGEMIVSSESADNGKPLRLQKAPGVQNTTVILSPLPPGDYTFRVQAVDASFRGSPFSAVKGVEVPVGLESVPAFRVFPNPASNDLVITGQTSGNLHISDGLSRSVFKGSLDAESPVKLSVADWPAGLYIVDFESGGSRSIQKLLVTR